MTPKAKALEALIKECEAANQAAVSAIGLGLIDLNAIERAKAALESEAEEVAEPVALTDQQIKNELGRYGALPLLDQSEPEGYQEGRIGILVLAVRSILNMARGKQ